MFFHYLREIKEHLAFMGFMAFCGWLALLIVIDMIGGLLRNESGDPVIPPPPLVQSAGPPPSLPAQPVVPSKVPSSGPPVTPPSPVHLSLPREENTPPQPPRQDCLNVEGTQLCLDG